MEQLQLPSGITRGGLCGRGGTAWETFAAYNISSRSRYESCHSLLTCSWEITLQRKDFYPWEPFRVNCWFTRIKQLRRRMDTCSVVLKFHDPLGDLHLAVASSLAYWYSSGSIKCHLKGWYRAQALHIFLLLFSSDRCSCFFSSKSWKNYITSKNTHVGTGLLQLFSNPSSSLASPYLSFHQNLSLATLLKSGSFKLWCWNSFVSWMTGIWGSISMNLLFYLE